MLKKIRANGFSGEGCLAFLTLFCCLAVISSNISSKEQPPEAMKHISGGAFIMGSNNGLDDEKPQHTVFVNSFFIDILPVSNADFAKFLNDRGLQKSARRNFL